MSTVELHRQGAKNIELILGFYIPDPHLLAELIITLKLILIIWCFFAAAVGPAFFMVAASYAGCDKTVVVILFTICMGLMGTFYAGMKLNPLDLSPNYSATLMAITNGIGSITGIVTPYLVGALTPNVSIFFKNLFEDLEI